MVTQPSPFPACLVAEGDHVTSSGQWDLSGRSSQERLPGAVPLSSFFEKVPDFWSCGNYTSTEEGQENHRDASPDTPEHQPPPTFRYFIL